jgi:hypothetical protein
MSPFSPKALRGLDLVAFWKLDIMWDCAPVECVISGNNEQIPTVRVRRDMSRPETHPLNDALEQVADWFAKEAADL